MKTLDFKKVTNSKLIIPSILISALIIGYMATSTFSDKKKVSNISCDDTCVLITDRGFSKDELAIKVGTFVEFKTADSKMHNLALGNGADHSDTESLDTEHSDETSDHEHDHIDGTESGEFGEGEAWRVEFKKAGTFVIHDHFNPDRSILVVAY